MIVRKRPVTVHWLCLEIESIGIVGDGSVCQVLVLPSAKQILTYICMYINPAALCTRMPNKWNYKSINKTQNEIERKNNKKQSKTRWNMKISWLDLQAHDSHNNCPAESEDKAPINNKNNNNNNNSTTNMLNTQHHEIA